MGGKGGGTDTTTTTSEPPAYLLPYLQRGQATAEGLYRGNPLYRPGFNQQQLAGLSGIESMAEQSVLPQTAADFAQARLAMTPQEQAAQVQSMADPYIEQFVPRANMASSMAGREGSGIAANIMGEGIGRSVAQQQAEFQRQQTALAQLSPALEAARYGPMRELVGVGDAFENRLRGQVEEPWERFGRYTALAFGNAPGALAGGTQVTTGPSQTQGFNPLGAILGLAGTAAGAYFGGPAGASVGGRLGMGLGGY